MSTIRSWKTKPKYFNPKVTDMAGQLRPSSCGQLTLICHICANCTGLAILTAIKMVIRWSRQTIRSSIDSFITLYLLLLKMTLQTGI